MDSAQKHGRLITSWQWAVTAAAVVELVFAFLLWQNRTEPRFVGGHRFALFVAAYGFSALLLVAASAILWVTPSRLAGLSRPVERLRQRRWFDVVVVALAGLAAHIVFGQFDTRLDIPVFRVILLAMFTWLALGVYLLVIGGRSLREVVVGLLDKFVPRDTPTQATSEPAAKALTVVSWTIILLGIALRTILYVYNYTIDGDEAWYVLPIIGNAPIERLILLHRPLAFTLLEKLIVSILGPSEYALRLIPYLSGVLALPVLYIIAKKWLHPYAVPAALGIFAIAEQIVFYTTNIKHFSSDIFVGLLLLWAATYLEDKELGAADVAWFSLAGIAAIWFAYSAIFVLAGVGLALFITALTERDWKRIGFLTICGVSWLLSFGLYLRVAGEITQAPWLMEDFRSGFMPLDRGFRASVVWVWDIMFNLIRNQVDVYPPGLGMFFFLLGLASAGLWYRQRLILAAPILFGYLAAVLGRYALIDRLTLFLTPFIILTIAQGIGYLLDRIRSLFDSWAVAAAAGLLVTGFVLYNPDLLAKDWLLFPLYIEADTRSAIEYVEQNAQAGDTVFVYGEAKEVFTYYMESRDYAYEDLTVTFGPVSLVSADGWSEHRAALDRLRGEGRVWLLFSNIRSNWAEDEVGMYLSYLEESGGQRLDEAQFPGAFVYLYDLSAAGVGVRLPTPSPESAPCFPVNYSLATRN